MNQKVKCALETFKRGYDFAYFHTKAPDVAGHKGKSLRKAKAIDRSLSPLLRRVREDRNLLLIVTGDHGTPSSGDMLHSGDSIPILFAGMNVLQDDVVHFNERHAARGGMGRLCIPSLPSDPVPLEIMGCP